MGSAKVQGDLWGRAPLDWANIQESMHIPLWEAMLNVSGVSKDTQFLDVGCGGGGASILATRKGAHVFGLDAAEGLIKIARERVPEGDFRIGDIEQLPFNDDMFNVVFAANSIQYAENRVAALHELGRVCKTNGRIVIALFSTPDKVKFSAIFKAIRDTLPEPPSGGGSFALSDSGKLENLIEQAGLKVLSSGEVNCPFKYQDFETFWLGNASAGPTQAVIQTVGKEKLKTALKNALEPFRNSEDIFLIEPNMYRYILATP